MESESREGKSDDSASNATAEATAVHTPDQEARADLVRWCAEHGLPVPPPPTDDRRASLR